MSRHGLFRRALCAQLLVLLLQPLGVGAQATDSYPARPIRLIVPHPPGEFASFVKAERAKFERAVKFSGARVD